MATLGGKKLNQLRVVDLRAELEKRGLDKSGLKGVLVERLEKSLLEESGELNQSVEEESPTLEEVQNGEEAKTPAEDEVLPEDFSGFIVLDSGDDSDHEEEDSSKKDGDIDGDVEDKNEDVQEDVPEEKEKENEEVEDTSNVEQNDQVVEEHEIDDEERSLEFEYQASETFDTTQDDKEQGEKVADVEEPNKEDTDQSASLSKPSDNPLSLSLFVNTDDVQDDLDEDLKEIEREKAAAQEELKEEEEIENETADHENKDTETDENVEEESAQAEVKDEEMSADENKVVEEAESKDEDIAENEEPADGQSGEEVEVTEGKEEVSEPKGKEKDKVGEKEDEKKEDKTEDNEDENKDDKNEEKKDVKEKSAKKEEPAKKAVKKEDKKLDKKAEAKDEKKGGADAKKKESGKSLWVSNLSSMTRAADLKTRFTQYGKVVGAKIVTNSKAPGAQCFGLVTMSTSEEAAKCIQHLHRTEMHGRNITVDRAKGDRIPTAMSAPSAKKAGDKKDAKSTPAKTKEDKGKEKEKTTEKKPSDKEKGDKSQDKTSTSKPASKTTSKTGKESDTKGEKGRSETASKSSNRSASSDKKDAKDARKSSSNRRSSPRGSDKGLKSLEEVRRERRERQIRERRERERRDRLRRERERIAREKAMERERARIRQRERERRRLQILREREERERQERLRLERERQRQRELERQRERERQERERERLLQERRLREDRERLERERERLERERLQRIERERLERQRIEERRGMKRPGDTYVRDRSPTRGPGYWQDTKRAAPDRSGDRDFFGGLSGRERGPRDPPETRPVAPRERRSEPRVSHSLPKRDDPSRDDHRRERERVSIGRSSREPPRDRESRDRRSNWENSTALESSSDPQKGLSLLLQRAGVSGILGDFSERSGGSLAKPLGPSGVGSSLSRERPGESWNGRSTHSRPLMSSQSLSQVPGRAPVMSDSGRGWPTSVEKDRDRARERDRGITTREMSRSAWSGSAESANLIPSTHSVGHDRSRQVVAPSRTAVPPRMVTQHSAGQPLGVTASLMDSRRPVAMSGRNEPFRSGVTGLPRSSAMRRY